MKENGQKTRPMAMAFINMPMGQSMRAIGKITYRME
jgi:hypothetical protein